MYPEKRVNSPVIDCPSCGTSVLAGFAARHGDRIDCRCGVSLELEEMVSLRARIVPHYRNEEYRRLGAIHEVQNGSPKVFQLGNRQIAVFRVEEKFYAMKNLCPHHGVELVRGSVQDQSIRCPGHGFAFDLQTGRCDRDPSLCASTYDLKIEGDDLYIRI